MKPLLVLICMLLVISCGALEPVVPTRAFTINDLLIDVSSMPTGWAYKDTMRPDFAGATDRISAVFVFTDTNCLPCIVKHEVHLFDKFTYAKNSYRKLAAELPGSPSVKWTYASPIADETSFACYYSKGSAEPNCIWIARYQEIIVRLFVTIAQEHMTYSDMESLARAIDARVISYMKR